MQFELTNFLGLAPEIILLSLSIIAQIFGVFSSKAKRINSWSMIIGIILVGYFCQFINYTALSFNESFAVSYYINLVKIIVFVITIISVATYQLHCKINNVPVKVEYLTLSFLSCLGVFIALSSHNLLLLFCGLELQSITVYALILFHTDNLLSTDSALKYFILSGMVTCISLLGISFIYGYGGSLQYADIGNLLNSGTASIGLVIGVVLLLCNLFFRLANAPFHFWTPDVYSGSPLSVIIFFSGIAIALVTILAGIFSHIIRNYELILELLKIVAILSMIVGSYAALKQNHIKKIIAYSAILNMGMVLLTIINNPTGSLGGLIFYATTYSISITGVIIALIMLVGKKAENVTLEDLIGSGIDRKAISAALMLLLFSVIGLPPFAGFFAKFYILYQTLHNQEYLVTFFIIVTNVVASYYYLRIIRYVYFDQTITQENRVYNPVISSILIIITLLVVLFSFYSDLITS